MTDNKKLNVVSDTSFNNKKIVEAKIDANENTVTNLNTENLADGVLLQTVNSTVTASTSALVSEKAVSLALSDKLSNLTEEQWAAVNSGITTAKVTTYDGYATGKQDALTTDQLNAVNSGITSAKVTTYDGYSTGKQDALSEAQLAAVNSSIDSTKVAQIATNAGNISTIENKIPAQASVANQLADKNFVNSSISTNTAAFIGTFNSVQELNNYSGTVDNNDYAFVISVDADGNTLYNRYKYTEATTPASWVFEYALNNSSFTAAQWATIQSGITAEKVSAYDTHITNKNNPHEVTKTQVGLGNVDNTSDSNKPVSILTQAELDKKVDKNSSITGATKTKITYDSKGLVTSGEDLAESDIPNLHLSKITDVTATAEELNYVDGVTGNIQGQINVLNNVTTPVTVDGSGAVNPTPTSVGQTFLNTTDKKVYTSTTNEYVINENVTAGSDEIDLTTGIASGFTTSSGHPNLPGNIQKNNAAITWNGNKNINIHFKLSSIGDTDVSYQILVNSSTHPNPSTYVGTSYTEVYIKNKKLYLRCSFAYIDNSEQWNELLLNYELQINKEYYLIINKLDTLVNVELRTDGYSGNLLSINEFNTSDSIYTVSGNMYYGGVYNAYPGAHSFDIGQVYLADSVGGFVEAASTIVWDDGATLKNKCNYLDTTNQKFYYYNNNILYATKDIYTAGTGISIVDNVISANLPIVNDAVLTIQKNGTTVTTFSANASSNTTANITVPTQVSDLVNDSGFITGINADDVTTALGYTPYSSTNPNGYTANVGTVTSVNNESPDSNGNVTITIPDPLPSQTGNAGKFLTTNGTTSSWETIASGSTGVTFTTFIGNTGTTLNTSLDLTNLFAVFRNGNYLESGVGNDYTVSGSTITFTESLAADDKIVVGVGQTTIITVPTTSTITSTTPTLVLASNTNYKCTNPLTSLTISSIPNSPLETNIYFTTDSTFTFNNSAITKWIGAIPTFDINTEYIINICNGVACAAKIITETI